MVESVHLMNSAWIVPQGIVWQRAVECHPELSASDCTGQLSQLHSIPQRRKGFIVASVSATVVSDTSIHLKQKVLVVVQAFVLVLRGAAVVQSCRQ